MTMPDIKPDYLKIVKNILKQFVPQFEVWAFGSRVAETAGEFSDLDLAIISNAPLDFEIMGRIRDAFSESDLPFKVDVLDWSATSHEFRRIIGEKHEIIQKSDR